MRLHLQRKRVVSVEQGEREMDRLDLSAFGDADDLVVAIIPNEEGVWLTIIQETAEPLDEVAILPGFHRAYPWPADPPEVLH